MEKYIQILFSSSLFYFVLGSIVTLIISYIFYRLSIQGPKLTYYTSSSIIIDKENLSLPNEFKIISGNNVINKLVRTSVYFWNSGNKYIRKEDLVKEDKLRIEFIKDTQIFYSYIGKNTDPSNGMLIKSASANVVDIQLNYLERKDGARIEILHNNLAAEAKLFGKVIGAKNGVKNSKDLVNTKLNSILDKVNIIFLYLFLIIISFFITYLTILINNILNKYWFSVLGLLIFVLFPAVTAPIFLKHYSKSKKYPARLD